MFDSLFVKRGYYRGFMPCSYLRPLVRLLFSYYLPLAHLESDTENVCLGTQHMEWSAVMKEYLKFCDPEFWNVRFGRLPCHGEWWFQCGRHHCCGEACAFDIFWSYQYHICIWPKPNWSGSAWGSKPSHGLIPVNALDFFGASRTGDENDLSKHISSASRNFNLKIIKSLDSVETST